MDTLGKLIVAAVGLEATMQMLRNLWDANVRAVWNFTRAVVVGIAVIAVVFFSDWNLVQGTGLDFGIAVFGRFVTGLAVGRAVYWIHDLYNKTAG